MQLLVAIEHPKWTTPGKPGEEASRLTTLANMLNVVSDQLANCNATERDVEFPDGSQLSFKVSY